MPHLNKEHQFLSLRFEVVGDAVVIFETSTVSCATSKDLACFVRDFRSSHGMGENTRIFYRDQSKLFCLLRNLQSPRPSIEITGTTVLEEALLLH